MDNLAALYEFTSDQMELLQAFLEPEMQDFWEALVAGEFGG